MMITLRYTGHLFGTSSNKKTPRTRQQQHFRMNPPPMQRVTSVGRTGYEEGRLGQAQKEPNPENQDPYGEPSHVRLFGNPQSWPTYDYREKEDRDYTKSRTGIAYKIKWDEKAESFPDYERLINNHCQQHDLGYLLIPHFMTMYLRHGTNVFERVPQYRKPGMSINQFLRDNSALYGILQSVFNVGIGIQLFRTPYNVQGYSDGIRMYVNIVNRLGPTIRTQKWIHEQAISERYTPRTKGGIRGFVHRYLTAYGELEYLGVKYDSEHCTDNLLKNLLCESTTNLIEHWKINRWIAS